MTIEQIVEAMARAAFENHFERRKLTGIRKWEKEGPGQGFWCEEQKHSLAALLTAANITEAQLLELANGTAVVVPTVSTVHMDIAGMAAIEKTMQTLGELPGWVTSDCYAAMLKARPQ